VITVELEMFVSSLYKCTDWYRLNISGKLSCFIEDIKQFICN
jgi:hypothetical protein